jgi:amidohydrolase
LTAGGAAAYTAAAVARGRPAPGASDGEERLMDEVEAARQAALAAIDAAAGDLVALSRAIHARPEVAMQEHFASAAAADFLAARGFDVERGVAGLPTAFVARRAGAPGRRVGYLAEYDALPGLGHGCGHNLICTAALGAGVGLAAALAHLPGEAAVFGTPAEEAEGGKIVMAEAGCFDGLDAALGAHPGTNEAAVATEPGTGLALACIGLTVEFHGRSAHAAADPENGVNALNALIEVFNGINALRQHVTPDVRLHGVILDGGTAANVVPDYARGSFMVRAASTAAMWAVYEKVEAIIRGAGLITGATPAIRRDPHAFADMIANHTLARRIKAHLDALGLPTAPPQPGRAYGSTDWGNVSYRVPSLEVEFPITTERIPWHSPAVVEAAASERGLANMLTVARALALTGVDLLADAAFAAAVRAEFEAALASRQPPAAPDRAPARAGR